tara:strand:+ start:4168 stop:4758 length:591 start_codon:yes stop_codon:yes gene_type:complete
MFLKNNRIFYLFVFFIFSFQVEVLSKEDKNFFIKSYLSELRNFSASFIQDDGFEISEGKIYIGDRKVRAEYKKPSEILIILYKKKGMYFNYELEEDEYFDPKDTPARFFYDIFFNLDFFNNAELIEKNNSIVLKKMGNIDSDGFTLEIFFEDNPLIIRRVELLLNDEYMSLSFFDHKYNEEFNENFFRLINPNFLN